MRALLVSVALSGAAVACAHGGDSDGNGDGVVEIDSGTAITASDSGAAGDTAMAAPPSDSGISLLDGSALDSSAEHDSAQLMPDSGGPPADAADDGAPAGACASPDICSSSSTNLGMIAGDEPGPPVTTNGYTSEWLRLDMSEMDNGLEGAPMILTATLTSPAGSNFDLYAYLGSAIDSIDCTMIKAQSTNPAGQTDSVNFMWGEKAGGLANGFNDSATVMLEIRWVSGACASTATWSITAQGD